MALKGNWPLLFKEVDLFFQDTRSSCIDNHETVDGDHGRIETRHYSICYDIQSALSAQQFAAAVGSHWGIGNRLHWIVDVVFHDDLMGLRTGRGPANMASVRQVAINIIKNINDKAGLKVKRKKTAGIRTILFNATTSRP